MNTRTEFQREYEPLPYGTLSYSCHPSCSEISVKLVKAIYTLQSRVDELERRLEEHGVQD